MSKVRIGVLGARRGASLAQAMKHAPSAELTAICDADRATLDKAAAATGVTKTYARYEELLDSDVDAVVVASPQPLHVTHSAMALKAGKHVLSEVMAASTMEQCWELLEAVKASKRKYMLAENYCYTRPCSLIAGMVKAGIFGEVYYGESDQIQEFKGGFVPPEKGSNWRTAELAMRRGHQYITHNLGPLYQYLGERVRTVACMGSGQHYLKWAKADDTCIVLCQTAGGKLARIRLDFFSDRPMNFTYLGLQGTCACYEAPQEPDGRHRIYVHGKTERGKWQDLFEYSEYLPPGWQRLPPEAVNNGYNAGAPLMIEDFARCVLDDTRPPIDVVDALNMTAPGILSEVSRDRGGAPVDVPEFK